jgi:hypothetical protein
MNRTRLSFSRSISVFVRVSLAAIFTVVLLHLWTSNTGRGFLPSVDRLVVLCMRPDGQGGWQLAEMREGGEDEPDRSPQLNRDELGVIIQEDSMGRTSFGEFTQWRASHWNALWISTAEGEWQPISEVVGELDPKLETAVARAVEQDLIPQSPPASIWPDVALQPKRASPTWWIAWQHRTSWGVVVVVPTICLALGCLAVACVRAAAKELWSNSGNHHEPASKA